jgi:hypothetical protein
MFALKDDITMKIGCRALLQNLCLLCYLTRTQLLHLLQLGAPLILLRMRLLARSSALLRQIQRHNKVDLDLVVLVACPTCLHS